MKLKLSLEEMLRRKTLLRLELERRLDEESARRAVSDYHAKRKPRPCGLTIHTVIGCTGRCKYCYLPDMGVSISEARVYSLQPDEFSLALLYNPYFLPGRTGTYLAVGSLGEPFHPLGSNLTIQVLLSFKKWLGNPIQFSTKLSIKKHVASLSKFREYPLSPLITIITLKKWKELEPGVASPEERFESIKALRSAGLYPIIFIRPILPGITDREINEILKLAKEHGAVGALFGSLRLSPSILARIRNYVNQEELTRRISRSLKPGKQTSIASLDLKRAAAKAAREIGLQFFFSACCANTYAAYLSTGNRIPCAGLCWIEGRFCTQCPVDCKNIEVIIDHDEVKNVASHLLKTRVYNVVINGYYLELKAESYARAKNRLKRGAAKVLLETGYRRRVKLAK